MRKSSFPLLVRHSAARSGVHPVPAPGIYPLKHKKPATMSQLLSQPLVSSASSSSHSSISAALSILQITWFAPDGYSTLLQFYWVSTSPSLHTGSQVVDCGNAVRSFVHFALFSTLQVSKQKGVPAVSSLSSHS